MAHWKLDRISDSLSVDDDESIRLQLRIIHETPYRLCADAWELPILDLFDLDYRLQRVTQI